MPTRGVEEERKTAALRLEIAKKMPGQGLDNERRKVSPRLAHQIRVEPPLFSTWAK